MLRFNAGRLSVATLGLTSLVAPCAVASGGEEGSSGLTLSAAATAPLTLDMTARMQPPESGKADAPAAPAKRTGYGQADGRWWLTLGTGVAVDAENEYDFNGYIDASTFVATDFEFQVEGAGWYFDQKGPNTGGISGSMIFRWHFWHDEAYSYTVFGDVGIGLLGSFDNTPADGSSFNFLPRVGIGGTFKIDDTGDRLQVGVRYHHISNARIFGDGDNPSRDSVMIYAGIIFPF